MAVLDYLRGFTSRDTTPIDASRFSLTAQYPGAGPFSGFSLTDPAAPPYGAPSPTLMTPDQQAFAQGAVPSGAAPPPADGTGADLSGLAGLVGSGFEAGQAVGGALAGPTAEQDIFMRHFGGQGGQPIDIEAIPPELAQFLQLLFQNGGFQ